MNEIYINTLYQKIMKGNDQAFKEKLRSFVKIRCSFCQGAGHISKSCPSKSEMYNYVRNNLGVGDELKNYLFRHNIQGWKMTQVGMMLDEQYNDKMSVTNANNILNNLRK